MPLSTEEASSSSSGSKPCSSGWAGGGRGATLRRCEGGGPWACAQPGLPFSVHGPAAGCPLASRPGPFQPGPEGALAPAPAPHPPAAPTPPPRAPPATPAGCGPAPTTGVRRRCAAAQRRRPAWAPAPAAPPPRPPQRRGQRPPLLRAAQQLHKQAEVALAQAAATAVVGGLPGLVEDVSFHVQLGKVLHGAVLLHAAHLGVALQRHKGGGWGWGGVRELLRTGWGAWMPVAQGAGVAQRQVLHQGQAEAGRGGVRAPRPAAVPH